GTQGCCDQPGFVVPTFFVNILGGLCSRVDQIGCGTGVVNTSSPQTGDNEIDKKADTSDPGPDCIYGTADDPAAKPCTLAGAGTGFTAALPDGPITVPGAPAGPARPQPYDGTTGSVTTAVSEVFSGSNSPIRDIGFVAITPNMPAVIAPVRCCSCTVTPGCPE